MTDSRTEFATGAWARKEEIWRQRLTWEKDWLQPFIEQANGFNLSWTRPCFCSDENCV